MDNLIEMDDIDGVAALLLRSCCNSAIYLPVSMMSSMFFGFRASVSIVPPSVP